MEKEHVTGKVDELKGKGKQVAGRATDDPQLETEGVVDEVKGKVKQAFGDFKKTVKDSDRQAGSEVHHK